ncbi:MAG: RNA methyltransferase, partial [Anaerolineales bacterium]|nr:RNA methyltransferase [Anaerolineales bacterium]
MLPDLTFDQKQDLVAYLYNFVTEHKRERIRHVLANRTRHLTVVLENIYQPHNASAVLRSCDCFGIQDVHIIEDEHEYRINPDVALGASKWLTLHRHGRGHQHNTRTCLQTLRANGYRIAATTLRPDSIPLPEFQIDQKTALCFGTEELGLSQEAHDLADVFVQIPMVGFTQSFNISVSAALTLYDLTNKLHTRPHHEWALSAQEEIDILTQWLIRTATHGRVLVRHYYRQQNWPIP